jgi:hypothetical protein
LTEDRAFGADDVAGVFYAGQRLRKLRFLMTDNTLPGHFIRSVKETASKTSCAAIWLRKIRCHLRKSLPNWDTKRLMPSRGGSRNCVGPSPPNANSNPSGEGRNCGLLWRPPAQKARLPA